MCLSEVQREAKKGLLAAEHATIFQEKVSRLIIL